MRQRQHPTPDSGSPLGQPQRPCAAPSQDPSAASQQPLDDRARWRELQSIGTGAGLLLGLMAGITMGAWLLGAAGVLWGGVGGAAAGLCAGWRLAKMVLGPCGASALQCQLLD